MLSEVLDILRVGQVLFLDVIPAVVFLPVMNLVLVLIISMVSGAKAKVRQLNAIGSARKPFMERDDAVVVGIVELENGLDSIVLLVFGDGGGGGIGEAVGAPDVILGPDARRVVVVQGEEDAGVESGDMMLFCEWSQ
jgi:hypothetical protein